MIADWQTNRIYVSGKLLEWFPGTFAEIEAKLHVFGYDLDILPCTRDIWARDYMPIQVDAKKFIECRYDPDYLQGNADKPESREKKTYPDIVCNALDLKTKKSDIILDGGNIVKSENGIVLTDKAVWENKRQYSEKQLLKQLHNLYEVEKLF